MKAHLRILAASTLVVASWACAGDQPSGADAAAPAAAESAQAVQWRHASNDADIAAAFAAARREHKPVFLYWGASWCPPCNQVKATLFNRIDFIERSRSFVPVYVDGDSPGAQKLGARFKVSGYPTMVLFDSEGHELTRLPGEVDARQYDQALALGLGARRPVKAVVAQARKHPSQLDPNDWKMLAFYSWEADDQQLVPKAQLPALLSSLAEACPDSQPDTAMRLHLLALAALEGHHALHADAARQRLLSVLDDAAAARRHMDVLTSSAADLVRAVSAPHSKARTALIEAFDATLSGLADDATLSRADRLGALWGQVDLAGIDRPRSASGTPVPPAPVSPALRSAILVKTAQMDREITNGYERQAVITEAAELLEEAGLTSESDAMLKANLSKSHAPYYLMSQLASNARKRGDKEGALKWYAQAYERAEGPATRLQWGSSYVRALVQLAPQDEARIERAATRLFDEAAAQPNAFYERSARVLQRTGQQLVAWNSGGAHAQVLGHLRARVDTICRSMPEGDVQRPVCMGLFSANPAKSQ